MTDLLIRLRDVAEATGPNEARQIALDAADRIEELEAELKKQALQYLSDTGELGERVGELTEILEAVDAWVEGLGYYADEGAELVPVFKRVKAVLGKGYK